MAGRLYTGDYERKLFRVMERLEVPEEKFNFEKDRAGCFIEFTYKGQLYRFEHSLDKAEASGQRITYTADLFAQLVMSLEDIARMTERGIYELSAWIAGMKALPSSPPLEAYFVALGFTQRPTTEDEVKARYKQMAKALHPDAGGDDTAFMDLTAHFEAAKAAVKG